MHLRSVVWISLVALCACHGGEPTPPEHQRRTLESASTLENEEMERLVITASAENADEGDRLSFSAAYLQGGKVDILDPTPLILFQWQMGDGTRLVGSNVSHRYEDEGTYNVRVSAQEGALLLTTSKQITIRNVSPEITLPGEVEVDENTNNTFSISVTDPGRDIVEVCWNFGELNAPSQCGTQLTSLSHNYEESGDYALTISADDGDGGVVTEVLPVLVNNVAPVIETNTERIIGVNQVLRLEASISDTPADDVTYQWDLPDAPFEVMDGSLAGLVEDGQVSLDVVFTEPGAYAVTLSASDDDSGETAVEVQVEVQPGEPPVATLNGTPGQEGEPVAFALSGSGAAPIVAWELDFGDGSPVIGDDVIGGQFNGFPTLHTYVNDGIYQARLTVTDAEGAQGDASLTVSIDNVSPEVILGVVQGDEGQEVVFQPTVEEPGLLDRDNLLCTWTLGDGSDAVTNDCIEPLRHTYAQDGEYSLNIIVQDDGAPVSFDAPVIINNVPPTVTLLEQDGTEGELITLVAEIEDPGQDALTVTWDLGDGEDRVLINNSAQLQDIVYPQDSGDGAFTLTVTVDDGQATDTATASVIIDNAAPTITAVNTMVTITEGDIALLSADVTDSGVLDSLSFQWLLNGDPVSMADQPSLSYLGEDDGNQSLQLQVEDGDDGFAEETFFVTVVNAPPRFNFDPVVFGAEGELYTQRLTVIDPGLLDVQTFTLVEKPDNMTLDGDVLTWTPTFEQANLGTPFAVSAVVDDGDGGTDTIEWEIALNVTDDDNDTLPDTCEATCPGDLDPNSPNDPNLDLDQDGIDNFTECQQGTSPCTSNAPAAPSLIAPVGGALIGGQVVLQARAEDPDDDPLTFTVEIEALDPMMPNTITIAGLSAIDGLMSAPLSPEQFSPVEDQAYRWRARANDGAASGPWSGFGEFTFSATNNPPTRPQAISPVGAVGALRPIFEFENAADPEGRPLTYILELRHPEDGVTEFAGIPEGQGGTTTTQLDEALEAGVSYLWSVRAVDEEGLAGPRSVAQTLRPGELASPNALLQFPGRHAILEDFPVRLIAARNPLFSGEVRYFFEVSSSEDFGVDEPGLTQDDLEPGADGLVEALFEGQAPAEDDTYFWRVRAEVSETADAVLYGEVRTFVFSTRDDPPSAPALLTPGDAEVVETLSPVLTFQPATDPERQPVAHTLEVFSDIDDLDGSLVARRRFAASASAEPMSINDLVLEDQRQYTWRVTGVDPGGQQSPAAVGAFTVRLSDLPPTPPTLQAPVSGQGVDADEPVTFTWLPSQDPARRPLTYDLEVNVPGEDAASEFRLFDIEGSGALITASTQEPLRPGFYVWRVRASNGVVVGPWSDAEVFKVPSPPVTPQEDPCEASPEDCEPEDLQPRYPGSLNSGCATVSGGGAGVPGGAWVLILWVLGLFVARVRPGSR